MNFETDYEFTPYFKQVFISITQSLFQASLISALCSPVLYKKVCFSLAHLENDLYKEILALGKFPA